MTNSRLKMAALMLVYRYVEYELSITQYRYLEHELSTTQYRYLEQELSITQYVECVVLCSIIPASFSVKLIFCIALSKPQGYCCLKRYELCEI